MKLLKKMQETKNFSATEQAIIRYILEEPKQLVHLSIRELAEKTFTSTAGVFRFCQKLGLTGYMEFKIQLISEISRTSMEAELGDQPITDQDNALSVVNKIACLEIEAIEETKNEIDLAQIMRVAELIDRAKQVDFYAFDDNLCIAQTACCHFMHTGKVAVVNSAANYQFIQAITSTIEHVAIILSRTGQNKKLIKIARLLREKKVKTILLTPEKGSALVKLCDEFLYVANTEAFLNLGSLIYGAGVQYILNVLFSLLLAKNYDQVVKINADYEAATGRTEDDWRTW